MAAARLAMIALALLFIGLGIRAGEQGIVFDKAVRVCLECIGVG